MLCKRRERLLSVRGSVLCEVGGYCVRGYRECCEGENVF